MEFETLPDLCERGVHAVAIARGRHDQAALNRHAATLTARYSIPGPQIQIIMLNGSTRPTEGLYLITVHASSR